MRLLGFTAVVLGVITVAATRATADVVVSWDLTGDPGNQATEPAFSEGPGITGSAMARGGGLNVSAAGDSFSSLGWDETATGAASTEYISFGFETAPTFSVDLEALHIGTRSSGTGPGTMGLLYSVDNYTTTLATIVQPNGTFVNTIVDLSALPTISGSVEFRLIEIGNTQADGSGDTASTGTFRVTDYFVGGMESTNVQITGLITSSVPEASAFLFGGLAITVASVGKIVARRRRRAATTVA